MENLFARHRFELIMLILWFYFTIWLGLQMKSQSHPSEGLCCECQAPAAHCGYLWAFHSFPSTRDVFGHLQEVVACHAPTAKLLLAADAKLLIQSQNRWTENVYWAQATPQTPSRLTHSFLLLLISGAGFLVFLVFQLHRIGSYLASIISRKLIKDYGVLGKVIF